VTEFVNVTLEGLVSGLIYAAFALSLVLIWRATRVLNFALPGMAMITSYLAYTVIQHGGSYWLGLVVALVSGLVIGAVVQVTLVRRALRGPALNPVVVTLGLLVLLESVAGMIYGTSQRLIPVPFSTAATRVGSVRIAVSPFDAYLAVAVLALVTGLTVLFRGSALGLRLRAAAFAPEVSRLLGVRVGRMLALGWALAAAVGSLAALVLPQPAFLSPTYLEPFLVYGFTAAVIGGLDSPPGAVTAGLGLGLALGYLDGYVSNGGTLVPAAALGALVVVLMIRPRGLFSRVPVRRV
jgi:branched-chain amino acid transport system permease protein